MKRASIVAVAILWIGFGSPSIVRASWAWVFRAAPTDIPEFYSSGGVYGTAEDATDGYESNDELEYGAVAAHAAVYRKTGNGGWDGPTGFMRRDVRAEILSPQQLPKVWDFYVWMDAEVPDDLETIRLSWWRSYPAPPPFVNVTLQFVRNAIGAPDNPDVGTMWNLMAYAPGPGNPDQVTVVLPAYRTDDGRNGYLFRMTAEVIPEPSSFAALVVGAAGLGALARRRRAPSAR